MSNYRTTGSKYGVDFGPSLSEASDDFQDISFWDKLYASKDLMDFTNNIGRVLRSLGFQDYSLYRFYSTKEVLPLVQSEPSQMASLRDALFSEEGLSRAHDLIANYIFNNQQPVFLATLERHVNNVRFVTAPFNANKKMFKLMKSFGYYDCFYIPLPTYDDVGKSALSITLKNTHHSILERKIQRVKPVLLELAEAVDFVGTSKFPETFLDKFVPKDITISPKPLELLDVMAREDMKLDEVSEFLGRSIYTVNQQIGVARKALGADTTHGAVYQAVREGLIRMGRGGIGRGRKYCRINVW